MTSTERDREERRRAYLLTWEHGDGVEFLMGAKADCPWCHHPWCLDATRLCGERVLVCQDCGR